MLETRRNVSRSLGRFFLSTFYFTLLNDFFLLLDYLLLDYVHRQERPPSSPHTHHGKGGMSEDRAGEGDDERQGRGITAGGAQTTPDVSFGLR